MAKRTPIDKLAISVEKILEEYGEDVASNTIEIVESAAKAGVKALKANSKATFGGTGAYASGWTSKVEKDRLKATAILYNKKPGLPHLLENGHAKRGGGRVSGRPHIAPVEQELATKIQSELESKL